jgi:uncharacterized protein with beta-barrel porin domain
MPECVNAGGVNANAEAGLAARPALAGSNFTINGAAIPHDSALTSLGAQLFMTTNWTLLAKFDGEFAPDSQTYAGSATLRYTW